MQEFDKLKDMEERVADLERELHWALVYEIESVCVFYKSYSLTVELSFKNTVHHAWLCFHYVHIHRVSHQLRRPLLKKKVELHETRKS